MNKLSHPPQSTIIFCFIYKQWPSKRFANVINCLMPMLTKSKRCVLKCLTIDNLRKRKVCIFDWCYMCKCNSESVDHLFLHCSVALELWDMVFGLFGVCWVMPMSVVGLFACWQGRFGRHRNGDIWKVVPHCLMWCIWKERNSRCFEDNECSMPDLKLLFFRTLLDWFSMWRNQHFSSILDLLVFCNVRF